MEHCFHPTDVSARPVDASTVWAAMELELCGENMGRDAVG
jgi:hypothetical protein